MASRVASLGFTGPLQVPPDPDGSAAIISSRSAAHAAAVVLDGREVDTQVVTAVSNALARPQHGHGTMPEEGLEPPTRGS
jgi:hypothetical protein